jgi:hypothetical protein
MVPRRLVNAEDLDLVHLSASLDDAVTIIERHKKKFDSARELLILNRRRAERAEKDPPSAVLPGEVRLRETEGEDPAEAESLQGIGVDSAAGEDE